MSAYSEPRDHEGDGFFPKPFDIDELEEMISRYIEPANDTGSENGKSGLR
jgi:hypothetical protein